VTDAACRECGRKATGGVRLQTLPSPFAPRVQVVEHAFCGPHLFRFLNACAKWQVPAEPVVYAEE
jgi:hypothetical protein